MSHPPRTPLSLLHHTTSVSAYRREAHEDLQTSFARFNITDANVRLACSKIETASYDIRVASGNPQALAPPDGGEAVTAHQRRLTAYREAKRSMEEGTDQLFAALKQDITSFLANPREGRAALGPYEVAPVTPRLWQARGALFLDLAYHCFYIPGFAASFTRDAELCNDVGERWRKLSGVDFSDTLQFIGAVVDSPQPQDIERAAKQADVLCRVLASEFKERGWILNW